MFAHLCLTVAALVGAACDRLPDAELAVARESLAVSVVDVRRGPSTDSIDVQLRLKNRGKASVTACLGPGRYVFYTVGGTSRMGLRFVSHPACMREFTIASGGIMEWREAASVSKPTEGEFEIGMHVEILNPRRCSRVVGCASMWLESSQRYTVPRLSVSSDCNTPSRSAGPTGDANRADRQQLAVREPGTGIVDRPIYRAALDAIVEPEQARLRGRGRSAAPPLVVFGRTIPMCPGPRPGPPSLHCVRSELESFERVHGKPSAPFTRAIAADTRAALATDFRERNHCSQTFPADALVRVPTASEDDLAASAGSNGRRVGLVRFSQPARSPDGHALVFASYACGTNCLQAWLILLNDHNGSWRVVDKSLAWIS